ncbi:hypothetical protein Q3A90_20260 [Priestia megaterium]|uniref:hypothetical protein n=1 Tax=Priestia megaterium TaxID=1404 RepID=UPI00267494D7|nr:hypothetical protein [Priestia megaterium]WKU22090.1 hypothetical protein Q3A90_20260 [Priestia megaterium]
MFKYLTLFIISFLLQLLIFYIIGVEHSLTLYNMIAFSVIYFFLTLLLDKTFKKKKG